MRNEEYQEIKEKEKILSQPTFLKRMLAGLIDIAIFLVLTLGLSLITKYSLYGPLGYNDAVEVCSLKYRDSHLYKEENETFYAWSNRYNENLTPEDNLDVHLQEYYLTDSRALDENKIIDYNTSKVESGLFYLDADGKYLRTSTANDLNVKKFLLDEYKKAIKFFSNDPILIENQRVVYYTDTYSRVIIVLISAICVYFIPPISSKYGETLGHRCLRLCLSTRMSNDKPSKGRIALRSTIFIIFNIVAPVFMQIYLNMIALVPIFITIIMMSFSKTGSSVHDVLSKTYVCYKQSMLEEVRKHNRNEKKEYGLKHV